MCTTVAAKAAHPTGTASTTFACGATSVDLGDRIEIDAEWSEAIRRALVVKSAKP
jgi:hypothetical protein